MASRFLAGLGQGLQTFAGLQTQANERKRAQEQQEAEMQRQVQRDALYKALTDAQIENLKSDNERADRTASLETYRTMFPEKKAPETVPESFQEMVGPKGPGVYRVPRGGQPEFMGRPIAKPTSDKPPSEAAQKNALGRVNAISAIRQAELLLREDPSADDVPISSEAAEGLGHLPIVGGALRGVTSALGQKALTPNQQKFRRLMDAMIHNSVGLLPGARQSVVLFNNVRDTYRPSAGASPASRAEARRLRLELARRLEQVQEGHEATESDLLAPSSVEETVPPAPPASIARPTSPRGVGPDPSRYFRP